MVYETLGKNNAKLKISLVGDKINMRYQVTAVGRVLPIFYVNMPLKGKIIVHI